MTYSIAPFALACLLFGSGCTDAPTGPTVPMPDDLKAGVGTPIVVMSRNMYVGADVDALIAALEGQGSFDPGTAMAIALQTLAVTDFPTRVAAMAEEIARIRPVAVGLQEVSQIDVSIPQLGAEVHQDFLASLLAALELRGLRYRVGASNQNFNFTGIAGMSVALADADVLLVDDRVEMMNSGNGTYSCPGLCIPLSFGTLTRGWVRVDTRIAGKVVTFVSSHPESGAGTDLAMLRAGQLTELMAGLPAGNAVILMGDLNDTPGSPMYQVLMGAGFTDLWAALRPGEPGWTCCHAADLQTSSLNQRIDYVMVRNGFLTGVGKPVGGARISLIDVAESDKAQGPYARIWPSDHAGVVATLPPAR